MPSGGTGDSEEVDRVPPSPALPCPTRFHFVRVALKRRRAFLELGSDSDLAYSRPWLDLSLGRFDDEQPYLGCRRARCGLCHPDKRWHRGADRQAAERAWREDWTEDVDATR